MIKSPSFSAFLQKTQDRERLSNVKKEAHQDSISHKLASVQTAAKTITTLDVRERDFEMQTMAHNNNNKI